MFQCTTTHRCLSIWNLLSIQEEDLVSYHTPLMHRSLQRIHPLCPPTKEVVRLAVSLEGTCQKFQDEGDIIELRSNSHTVRTWWCLIVFFEMMSYSFWRQRLYIKWFVFKVSSKVIDINTVAGMCTMHCDWQSLSLRKLVPIVTLQIFQLGKNANILYMSNLMVQNSSLDLIPEPARKTDGLVLRK